MKLGVKTQRENVCWVKMVSPDSLPPEGPSWVWHLSLEASNPADAASHSPCRDIIFGLGKKESLLSSRSQAMRIQT